MWNFSLSEFNWSFDESLSSSGEWEESDDVDEADDEDEDDEEEDEEADGEFDDWEL